MKHSLLTGPLYIVGIAKSNIFTMNYVQIMNNVMNVDKYPPSPHTHARKHTHTPHAHTHIHTHTHTSLLSIYTFMYLTAIYRTDVFYTIS